MPDRESVNVRERGRATAPGIRSGDGPEERTDEPRALFVGY